MNNWFTVDKQGLAQLQKGKSKTFIINELTQNAWDEDIKECIVNFTYNVDTKQLTVTVKDDNPEGFKDITHAYTLFADTYKRRDSTKRGRFNLGEKQVIAICNSASVSTTKGMIKFDEKGRHEFKSCRTEGSVIKVTFDATFDEYKELKEHAKTLLVPEGIKYVVDGEEIPHKTPTKMFTAFLDTEVLKEDRMTLTTRKTTINLIETDSDTYIYEMGIPIMKIDTPWHIDIQQKIPLAVDRQTVTNAYIKDVYAEVLNNTYQDLTSDQASEVWVRTAMKDKRIIKEAAKHILDLRFGNKLLVGNSFDPNANDEATAHGFNVISGNIMSKDEWNTIRNFGLIKSTSDMFGHNGLREAKKLKDITTEQKAFANFAKKVAKEFLHVNIDVIFVSCKGVPTVADYGNRTLRFNVGHSQLHNGFFDKLTYENIDLLLHELGHEEGNHTEHNYHKCITEMAGKLVMKAIQDPDFFEVN